MRAREFIAEGGWASTATQNTVITPQLVANAMKLLQGSFVPSLNQFLKTKDMAPTKISRPGGSATYYERDLVQNPSKEYGDVDVQFHIPRIEGMGNSANEATYRNAVKEFCEGNQDFSTENGTNVIMQIGKDVVQVDLIMSYFSNARWIDALKPEWNVKGVLANSIYSAFGQALNISMGGSHGVQVKTIDGRIVPFRNNKGVTLHTITNNPDSWAIDIAKYFGCKKLSPLLSNNPGMPADGEIRIADMINSIRGIAESLEINSLLPNGINTSTSFLMTVKKFYLDKIDSAIRSPKFDKAETPMAIEHAKHTKEMLFAKSREIARLFG